MRICVPILLVALSGCTAIKSSVHLIQAEQDLTKAEQRNADDEAIYEYTMALRYLEKAREENGYSDYKDSAELSKSSSEWSEKAVMVVEMGGPSYRPPPPEASDELPDGSDDELAPLDDEPPATPEPAAPAPAAPLPEDDGDLPDEPTDLLGDE